MRLIARAAHRRCRTRRSSMPISPAGSATSSRAEPGRRRSSAGGSGSPACPLWSCRRIGPRPPIRSARGALHQLVLSPELSAAVRAVARREGVTPFMTLLAAFQLVLGRWSGQDDFAVGAPVANRNRPETERLIGYFVNMIALRADLSGNPTAREFLARVREVALEAFENQEVPLEVLIPALGPRRDASRSPLFQVMFVLQNNPMPAVGPLDLAFSPLDIDQGTGTSKFDLSLGFEDTPGRVHAARWSSTPTCSRPRRSSGSRTSTSKRSSTSSLIQNGRLSELSLLTDAERGQVVAWSHAPRTARNGDIPDSA